MNISISKVVFLFLLLVASRVNGLSLGSGFSGWQQVEGLLFVAAKIQNNRVFLCQGSATASWWVG